MRKIRMQAVREGALHNPGERHELHIEASNVSTVIRFTDAELAELATVLADYRTPPQAHQPVCEHGFIPDGQACEHGCLHPVRYVDADGELWVRHSDGLLHWSRGENASWGTPTKVADAHGPMRRLHHLLTIACADMRCLIPGHYHGGVGAAS